MSNDEDTYIEQAKKVLSEKTALCFEGGGVLGIGHVGALARLSEIGGLKNITHVVGTSVGSIITAAFGCGADVEYIQNIMFSLDLQNFKDSSKCVCIDLFRFFKKFGWYKGKQMENLAGSIMNDLTGNPNITFLEAFNKFGIKLTIVYLSVNYGKPRYANHITEPNLQIKQAVRRSSAIPLFYQAVWNKRIKKALEVIIDGGVTDNYPIHVLKEQGCPLQSIIGFKLCNNVEFNEYKEDMGEEVEEIDNGPSKNMYKHTTNVIEIIYNQNLRYHVHKEDWKLTTKINVGELTSTSFGMTEEQKIWLYNEGKAGMDKHIEDVAELISKGEYPLDA